MAANIIKSNPILAPGAEVYNNLVGTGDTKKIHFADIQKAEKHGAVNKIYKPGSGQGEACECCGLKVGTQYKLIENIDDLGTHEALRSGYILYFRFLKHSGLLLSIIFVISGLFNIISNLASGDCEPNGTKISDTDPRLCSKDFITIFTIANKKDHDDLITAQAALNLIALLVMVCYFHYMRIDFRYIVLKEDEEDTPSDYTLRIDGLKDIKPEWSNTEIKDYFNNLFKGKEAVHVVNVIRTFKISEYVQSRNKLERYKNRLKTAQNKITQEENSRKKGVAEKLAMLTTMDDKTREAEHKKIAQAEEVDRKIKEIEDYKLEQYKRKVTKHERKILKYQQQGLEYGSSVFVTFEYPEEAQKVIDEFNIGSLRRILLCKKRIKAQRAPEPNEVIWENVGVPSKKKLKVRIFGWSAFLILIAASFGVILSLNYLQITTTDELGPDSPVVQVLSITTSCLIMIVNFFLEQAFLKVSKYEKYSTYMDYFTEFTERLIMAQLLNTGFITLITKIMVRKNLKVDFFSPGGLLNQMNYVFLMNAFLQPSIGLFDYNALLKKAQQRMVSLKYGANIEMEQSQLNKLYEATYFTITQKYASVNKTVFLTCFYATASPLLVLYSIAGLLYKYWTEKYIFIRKSSKPNPLGYGLNREMMEVFEWNALMFSLGSVYVGLNLNDVAPGARAVIFVILAISVLNIYLPMETINERVFPDKKIRRWKGFHEKETIVKPYSIQKFQTDYEMENLVTRKKALDRISKLQGLGVTESRKMIVDDDLKDPDFFLSLDKYFHEAKLSSEILTSHKPPKKPQTSLEIVTNLIGQNRIKGLAAALFRKVGSTDDIKDNTSITEKKEELESSHLDHTIAGSEIPPNTIESKARERPTGALATFGRNLLIKNLQRKATTELDHVNTESSGLERKDSKEINTTPSPSISLRTPQGNKVPLPGINPITGNSQVNKDKELPKPPQAQPKKKGGLGLFLFGDIFNKTPVIQEDKTEQIESARLRKKSNDNIKKKSEFNKNMNDSSIIDSQPILTNEGMTTPSAAGGDTSRHLTTKRVDKSVVLTPEEIQRQETILQVVVDNFFGPNENPILGNEEVLAEHPSILFEADRFGDDD